MSGGVSDSSSNAFPGFSKGFFKTGVLPFTQQLLSSYDPTGGPDAAEANKSYKDTLDGDYLNPDSNPYLSQSADAIQRGASQAFARALGQINDGAQTNGSLFSTKTSQIQSNAARESAADVTGSLSNLYNSNYQNERGIMANAAPQATAASQLDLNQLLQFMSLLKGGVSKSSSIQGGIL